MFCIEVCCGKIYNNSNDAMINSVKRIPINKNRNSCDCFDKVGSLDYRSLFSGDYSYRSPPNKIHSRSVVNTIVDNKKCKHYE